MNAVGIDVSKGKSMVAAMRPMGEVALSPREYLHTEEDLERLVIALQSLEGETRVVMEATGRYHEAVAQYLHENGIFVSVVNPILIHGFGNNSIRKVKTDKKDSVKIARYGLENWAELREHTPVDAARQQLKLVSRQYNLFMGHVVALTNNLIALLDKTFPGANELFTTKPTLIFTKLNGLTDKPIANAVFRVDYEQQGGGVATIGTYRALAVSVGLKADEP